MAIKYVDVPWDKAACADEDKRLFFPDEPGMSITETRLLVKAAKEVCSGCEIKIQCASWAIQNNEKGIWGGTTTWDRKLMRRNAKRSLPITSR
jgi:WhiB family redox-sensing transcriptional regulator